MIILRENAESRQRKKSFRKGASSTFVFPKETFGICFYYNPFCEKDKEGRDRESKLGVNKTCGINASTEKQNWHKMA